MMVTWIKGNQDAEFQRDALPHAFYKDSTSAGTWNWADDGSGSEGVDTWRKIETFKFQERKTMKDPKLILTAEVTAQMARDRYENWDVLL